MAKTRALGTVRAMSPFALLWELPVTPVEVGAGELVEPECDDELLLL